ncbi:hypothetical protein C8R46DRAFT_1235606 [Mycena filopes]|nr:hypothetical protein C8R46DRAFT_1235606 [Mycena filopes]
MSSPSSSSKKAKSPTPPTNNRRRAFQACLQCRRRKTRCITDELDDGDHPCARCTRNNLTCEYGAVTKPEPVPPELSPSARCSPLPPLVWVPQAPRYTPPPEPSPPLPHTTPPPPNHRPRYSGSDYPDLGLCESLPLPPVHSDSLPSVLFESLPPALYMPLQTPSTYCSRSPQTHPGDVPLPLYPDNLSAGASQPPAAPAPAWTMPTSAPAQWPDVDVGVSASPSVVDLPRGSLTQPDMDPNTGDTGGGLKSVEADADVVRERMLGTAASITALLNTVVGSHQTRWQKSEWDRFRVGIITILPLLKPFGQHAASHSTQVLQEREGSLNAFAETAKRLLERMGTGQPINILSIRFNRIATRNELKEYRDAVKNFKVQLDYWRRMDLWVEATTSVQLTRGTLSRDVVTRALDNRTASETLRGGTPPVDIPPKPVSTLSRLPPGAAPPIGFMERVNWEDEAAWAPPEYLEVPPYIPRDARNGSTAGTGPRRRRSREFLQSWTIERAAAEDETDTPKKERYFFFGWKRAVSNDEAGGVTTEDDQDLDFDAPPRQRSIVNMLFALQAVSDTIPLLLEVMVRKPLPSAHENGAIGTALHSLIWIVEKYQTSGRLPPRLTTYITTLRRFLNTVNQDEVKAPTPPPHITSVFVKPNGEEGSATPSEEVVCINDFNERELWLPTRLCSSWEDLCLILIILHEASLYTTMQIQGVILDPVILTIVEMSTVCLFFGTIYSSILIIVFKKLAKVSKGVVWIQEAKQTSRNTVWNAWILMSLPLSWISWGVFYFAIFIMTFLWRSGNTSSPEEGPRQSQAQEYVPRVLTSSTYILGVLYLVLTVYTVRKI